MKELSIEEKAKCYDEAIEKLHEIITMDNKPVNPKEIGEYLFPELIESEDEKARKRIIALVNAHGQGMYKGDMLAWLEKQGEKKATIEMKSAEESLGIDSETYNKIVDECVYGEQKSSWSEEDEEMLDTVIEDIIKLAGAKVCYHKDVDWLKSLKERYTWKPSDEQIKGIECAIKTLRFQLNVGDKRLDSLYDALKKLKG